MLKFNIAGRYEGGIGSARKQKTVLPILCITVCAFTILGCLVKCELSMWQKCESQCECVSLSKYSKSVCSYLCVHMYVYL